MLPCFCYYAMPMPPPPLCRYADSIAIAFSCRCRHTSAIIMTFDAASFMPPLFIIDAMLTLLLFKSFCR